MTPPHPHARLSTLAQRRVMRDAIARTPGAGLPGAFHARRTAARIVTDSAPEWEDWTLAEILAHAGAERRPSLHALMRTKRMRVYGRAAAHAGVNLFVPLGAASDHSRRWVAQQLLGRGLNGAIVAPLVAPLPDA